jgi:signal transduction histidine kinase/CheY-like chemotaxis protein/ligand-binding sensor domain-containing protein
MKTRLLVILSLFIIFQVNAAKVKIYSINSLFGISIRETSSICTDKNGFIWATSKTGIARLTTDDYKLYELPAEAKDFYMSKLVYSETGLVVYTHNGQIFKYNDIYDRFDFIIDLRNVEKFLRINRLLVDAHGTFWIATSSGLYKYSKGKLENLNKGAYVDQIEWKSENEFMGYGYDGFWIVNINVPKSKIIISHNPAITSQVMKLYYDKEFNLVWFGTLSSGLYVYDFRNKSFYDAEISAPIKQPIRAIRANSDSTLLIGVDGQGIYELSRKTKRVIGAFKEDIDDEYSLHGNGVYDIFCDQNNRVWVSTYGGGISFFDQTSPIVKQISHYVNSPNSLSNNFINKVIEDSRGNIWFATNNGLCKWDMKTDRWTSFYHNYEGNAKVFLTVREDNKGRIWAGTYSSGVYVIDGNSGREVLHFYQNDKVSLLTSNFVVDVFNDRQGNMWIGEVSGFCISYNTNDNKFRRYEGGTLSTIIDYNSDNILLGCTWGLVILNKQSGQRKTLFEKTWVNDAVVIGENVWVCTRGDGLYCYNIKSNKLEKFTTKSGLQSNYINSVINIGDDLWLGTESGLCKFNTKTKATLTFSSLFPIANVSFNQSSRCKLRNGSLIWGTSTGAVIFNPLDIKKSEAKGKIYFDDLIISGRSIREESIAKQLEMPLDSSAEISLNYNQNTLKLKLLPIGTSASDTRFSWKMEGLETTWSQPVNQRTITYTNLSSGTYNLKIRLYDSSMSHIISERSISINIIPPFWKTWWFILFSLIIVLSIAYFLLRYYLNYIRQLHAQERIHFFTNTAHDMRTSLTLISSPIEELGKEQNISNSGRYYLHLATEQVKRLTMIVTQLMDFQKMDTDKEMMTLRMVDIVKLVSVQKIMFESFAQNKEIEIVLESNETSYFSAVDETIMEKVIGNLISNALKYSHKNSQVIMKLECSHDNWVLDIIDHGIGVNRSEQQRLFKESYRGNNSINSKVMGFGIGLLLVKNYVEMHGGIITYESKENVGSSFSIQIPFKEVVAQSNYANYKQSDIFRKIKGKASIEAQKKTDTKRKEMKILIVEDNDDLRNFMKTALAEEFEISVAEDGQQAWEIIMKKMPDLVVSDTMMTDMDGYELCELIKSTYVTSHIPIILLTTMSERTEQMRGLGLGADDYMTKPLDMTLLSQRIKSIIRNRERIREKALKLIKGNETEPILVDEKNDKFIKKAIEVVYENIAWPGFGKDQFAAAMNVSSSLLYKKIKSLTNQSPVDFIKTIRLNYSLELLQSKRHSVTEISEMCGFASVGYFSTVFKKHFGKSPTDN